MSRPDRPASPRQVLLGLFILVQIAYLLLTNLITYIKWLPTEMSAEAVAPMDVVLPGFARKAGHAWYWSDEVETAIRRYAQLTGQDQQWGLFTPVGKTTGFPAVLMLPDAPGRDPGIEGATLTFDAKNGFHLQGNWDRPEVMLSDNEPRDRATYIRIGRCRLRKFDGSVYIHAAPREGDTENTLATRLNERVHDLLHDYRDLTLNYLRWKVKAWQRAHPDGAAPKQVILLQRCFRIHDPEEEPGWDGPFILPIARWQPALDQPNSNQSLESFDFLAKRFVPAN